MEDMWMVLVEGVISVVAILVAFLIFAKIQKVGFTPTVKVISIIAYIIYVLFAVAVELFLNLHSYVNAIYLAFYFLGGVPLMVVACRVACRISAYVRFVEAVDAFMIKVEKTIPIFPRPPIFSWYEEEK